MPKYTKAEIAESLDYLTNPAHFGIVPGETIHVVMRHRARSGMMRILSLFVIRNGVPLDITVHASRVVGLNFDRDRWGAKIGGCGMDMGFQFVYLLSSAIFPNGFQCIGERCPSNDHSNGDRDYSGTTQHKSGGYALRHRWM